MSSTTRSRPKVLLFDIGGVCVCSPFQAILDYEVANKIPVGYINYNIRALTPNGAWHKIERGEIANDSTFFKAFKTDLERVDLWKQFHREKLNVKDDSQVPSPPNIDTETLYWNMMNISRLPDPWMYPALVKLKQDGRYHLAAVSNTTVFPPGHPLSIPDPTVPDVKSIFPVFVSSAHVGMRKPNRDIYEYTLSEVRKKWGRDIQFEDIMFVDDIGENVKMGRKLGMGTIKPMLGKTKDAVRELEEATGLTLISEPWTKGREAKL